MSQLLIIEDESVIRNAVERLLTRRGYQVKTAESVESAEDQFDLSSFNLILTDVRLPGVPGTEVIKRAPNVPVLIMTSYASVRSAVDSMKQGAIDYIAKPFDHDELVMLIERTLKQEKLGRKTEVLKSDLDKAYPVNGMVGNCQAMQEVCRRVAKVAPTDTTVLILGESGTGKELVARALHEQSLRREAPIVTVNCAAIPETLIESELFGHEKGAFTGADTSRTGLIEAAEGGTLFLDEIGDMPAELQTRLLRVLADGEFYRVGGHEPVRVDVRIIAATHQNLEQLVKEGRFREDLFHRLNVIRIHIPSLRERREDIGLLMRHFLALAADELGVECKTLLPETLKSLEHMSWPGNVRQLENTARWLTVMASSQEIHIKDLPPELLEVDAPREQNENWHQALRRWARHRLQQGNRALLDEAMPLFETIMIETALEQTGGRKQDAAKLLGWGRNTLTRKIKELGLEEHPPQSSHRGEKDGQQQY